MRLTPAPMRAAGPRAMRGVKWKFPTGGRVVASAVARDAIDLFRQR